MLEVLRVLAQQEKRLRHSVIFLFNGAEETPLQAAHGFITQHPWAKEIRGSEFLLHFVDNLNQRSNNFSTVINVLFQLFLIWNRLDQMEKKFYFSPDQIMDGSSM